MACLALISLLALALCAAPAMAILPVDLAVSGTSIRINRASAGAPSLPVFDNSWVTSTTPGSSQAVCVGQILYSIENIGDAPISPYVFGPIRVSTPADYNISLVSPKSFQYMTTVLEGTKFATGFDITNVGYYADKGQTSVFALTMSCSLSDYDAEVPANGCICPGADTITFDATTNTTSGKTKDVCGTNGRPGVMLDDTVCVSVERQNQTNTGLDQYWTDGHSRCIGHTLFTITNHGLSPISQLSTNTGSLAIDLGGSTQHGFYYPLASQGMGGECCEYNYYADDLRANGTTVTIVDAGYYMLPGASSTFAVTTWCKAACPCTGATFTIRTTGAVGK